MKRILAWAGILAIGAAFIALIVFTATGASANAILALLLCLLILPVLFYGLSLFARLRNDRNKTEKDIKDGEC